MGRLFELPPTQGGIDLEAAMSGLAEAGLTRILVEGGGQLAAALLRAGLIDEVHWMLAPRMIGSDGRAGLGPLELQRLSEAVAIGSMSVKRRGEDLHLHGLVEYPGTSGAKTRKGGLK